MVVARRHLTVPKGDKIRKGTAVLAHKPQEASGGSTVEGRYPNSKASSSVNRTCQPDQQKCTVSFRIQQPRYNKEGGHDVICCLGRTRFWLYQHHYKPIYVRVALSRAQRDAISARYLYNEELADGKLRERLESPAGPNTEINPGTLNGDLKYVISMNEGLSMRQHSHDVITEGLFERLGEKKYVK